MARNNTGFHYVVDATADEPIMLMNGVIGEDVDGARFQSELLRLDAMENTGPIKVFINSPGGAVADGMAIYNAILRTKRKVDTYNCGLAASIAAVIFQAGRKRYSADYSVLMFHSPYYPGSNVVDPYLEAMKDACNIMIARSGMSKEEIESMMNMGDTFLTPEEALTKGLTDEIECSSDFNKKRMSTGTGDAMASYKLAGTILNSIKNNTDMAFPLVTSKLKLNADASEQSIVEAIALLETKHAAVVTASAVTATELQKAKDDLAAAALKYDKLAAEYKIATDLVLAADEATTVAKATAMVTDFAKLGKIKNEPAVIAKWVARAKADFENVKADLDELPLNVKSNSLTSIVTPEAKVNSSFNAEARMIEIANRTK